MCDLTTAMAAFQVVQGVTAQNAAVEQANAQNALYRQNAVNAREAALNDFRALNRRQAQEGDKANQESFQKSIEALQKKSTVTVAAGEGGVSGNSVNRILDSYDRQKSVAQGTIQRNFDYMSEQIGYEKEGAKSQFQNRVNSVQKGYAPSAFQAGLGIATNVASTAYTADKAGYFGKETNPKAWWRLGATN